MWYLLQEVETNTFTFNPTITYDGDTITMDVANTDTNSNSNSATNTDNDVITFTDTNTIAINASVIPILINTINGEENHFSKITSSLLFAKNFRVGFPIFAWFCHFSKIYWWDFRIFLLINSKMIFFVQN